jgi:predicted HD phosphohydrolase
MNTIFSKPFLITLFLKQNKHHQHSVLGHTLKVTYSAIKMKHYRFIIPALLHDVGKPYSAYQDAGDKLDGTYSFTNHEELSWHIVKRWVFLSNWTKDVIRYHYLVRDIYLCEQRGKAARLKRIQKRWDKLSPELREDLKLFLMIDDAGK